MPMRPWSPSEHASPTHTIIESTRAVAYIPATLTKRVLLAFLTACAADATEPTVELAQETVVCGDGPTVKGIDVSYYQGTIDWTRVAADGVKYAFIRASDGLNTPDSKFDTNWSQAKARGVLRGAYQFFRPAQDPIAQADLMLSRIGTLAPDDLPPVIDVEADGGLAPAVVAERVKQWIDRVEAATGRKPIIYTGYYFWRDEVGSPAFAAGYPLWHAQYTSAACPNIPEPWTDWAFWQFTAMGSVDGITGDVDVNRFNGTEAQLLELAGGMASSCGVLPRDGGTIDDGDACFTTGGAPASLRHVTTAGEGGDLLWTYADDAATESNFAHWAIELAEAGRYQVEVYTAAAFAQTTRAVYVVTAAGTEQTVVLDQSAADGWQTLGTFDFAAGAGQSVHLGDNTGEPVADKVQIVFDAIRLTRIETPNPQPDGVPDPTEPDNVGCCSASGGTASAPLALALLAVLGRRRRPV